MPREANRGNQLPEWSPRGRVTLPTGQVVDFAWVVVQNPHSGWFGTEARLPLRYTPSCGSVGLPLSTRPHASLRPIAPGKDLHPLPPWDAPFLGAFLRLSVE